MHVWKGKILYWAGDHRTAYGMEWERESPVALLYFTASAGGFSLVQKLPQYPLQSSYHWRARCFSFSCGVNIVVGFISLFSHFLFLERLLLLSFFPFSEFSFLRCLTIAPDHYKKKKGKA